MRQWKRRLMAGLTGTCAAILVFSMAFAVSPSLMLEESTSTSSVYLLVSSLTDEDMEVLQSEYMDADDLAYIKDVLVEDSNETIMMSYIQLHPEFVDTLEEYTKTNN